MESGSSVWTPHLDEIITSLIETIERTGTNSFFLTSVVYETLNKVVSCSYFFGASQIITQLLSFVIYKLHTCQNLSPNDREKKGDLQSLLCGVFL